MKLCTKCNEGKDELDFYKDKNQSSGLKPYCKSCDKGYKRSSEAIKKGRLNLKNKEYVTPNKRDNDKKYRSSVKGKISKLRAKNKRRSLVGQNTLSATDWIKIISLFGNKCAYCQLECKLTVDHIVPVIKGGGTTYNNVIPSCHNCNSKKRDKNIKDFCTTHQIEYINNVLNGL